jgi:hypothetical protein
MALTLKFLYNIMKKTLRYCVAALLMMTAACTKDFTKINTNPAAFTNPEPEAVLSGVFKNTIDRFELTNIRTFWEYAHQIEPGGQRYNVGDEVTWTTLYINVLGNTTQLKKLYRGNALYANRLAITDIWECYVYAYLVGTYGPVPYSHMGDTSNPDVEYDDENTIYTSLLLRLKADAAAIKVTGGDKYTTDPIYGGDMSKWIKFANSLRLRIALTVQNNLPDLAASNAKELMGSETTLLTSEADDPKLSYGTAAGSQSQYNVQLVQGSSFIGTSTPVMSDYLFTYFRSYKDPRIDSYFNKSATPFNITDTLTSTTTSLHYIVSYPIPYLGEPKATTLLPSWNLTSPADPNGVVPFFGAQIPANYSTLQASVVAQAKPFYMMTYGELCYLKAEAAQRGYGGSQSPDQYYYAGINASFAFWGLSQAQASAYAALDGIKWNTAGKGFNYDLGFVNTSIPNDNLKRIWIQEWINFFPDEAFEAWVLQRRTQNLALPPHSAPGTVVGIPTDYLNLPDRFIYPTNNESVVNPVGYKNGLKLLGGPDYINTRLKIEPVYTPVNWDQVHPFYDISFVQKWYGTTYEALQASGVKFSLLNTY